MLDIRGWIRRQRYGGITGQSQTQAQVKVILLALIPLMFVMVIAQSSFPEEFKGFSTLIALGMDGGIFVFVYMKASTDVVKLIPLPSAHTHLPDGVVKCYDFKIQAGGIIELCDFPDGSKGYRLQFIERYEHRDPKLPFAYVFQAMYLKTFPKTDFDKAVPQVSEAEVFHENMYVTHPRTDLITIWVKEWVETNEGWIPNAVLGATSYSYLQFLKAKQDPLDTTDLSKMTLADAQRQVEELQMHNETLEISLETMREQKGRKHKEQVDKTLSAIRDGVHDIDETGEPILQRIFKIKNLLGITLIVIGTLLLFHFLWGWP